MQAARIWFQNTVPPITLSQIKEYLQGMGIKVRDVERRLGDYVVPQLYITNPADLLMQIEDEDWVIEEAEQFSQFAPASIRDRLSICNARLCFGDARDDSINTDHGTFVLAGWTSFDPGKPQAKKLLESLARLVNGLFEDNTTGDWWAPI